MKEGRVMTEKKPLNVGIWAVAVLCCTLGVSLCTKSNLGMSMIGAMPYILHKFMIQTFPWFSQGTAEYFIEAIIIIITGIIIRKYKIQWLLSFATAVIVGLCIDGWLFLLGGNGPVEGMVARVIFFITGMVITSFAIALFFRTRMPLQAYELAVVEISERYNWDKSKVKYVNDILYLVICLAMSLLLLHKLVGIGVGTIVITFANAPLIALFTKMLDKMKIPK